MTKAPKLTSAILALVLASAGSASADAAAEVETNVNLFDQLLSCSTASGFTRHGFNEHSPCRTWFEDMQDQRDADPEVAAAGYDCLADELIMGGHLLWIGDNSGFNQVKQKVDICRVQIALN